MTSELSQSDSQWKARLRLPFLTCAKRSCYNRSGGGNSSTGRAPDCGSDGCGFDSRFPPQNFLLEGAENVAAPPFHISAYKKSSPSTDHIGKRVLPGTFFLAVSVDRANRAGLEFARIFLRARLRLVGPVAVDRGEADSRAPAPWTTSALGGAS